MSSDELPVEVQREKAEEGREQAEDGRKDAEQDRACLL